jgi:hypothetical protein
MARAVLAGVLAAGAFVATGCGRSAQANAQVAGTVRSCSVFLCVPEPVRVSVLDLRGRVVKSTRSTTGHFSVTVMPGSYEVSVETRRYLVGTAWVDAVAGRTAIADFTDRRAG